MVVRPRYLIQRDAGGVELGHDAGDFGDAAATTPFQHAQTTTGYDGAEPERRARPTRPARERLGDPRPDMDHNNLSRLL